jgi:hypothetical protein
VGGREGIGNEFKVHLVNWSGICTLLKVSGLRLETRFSLIELYLVNGYGIMLRKGRLRGDW